jgi:hypothetical protein
VAALDQLGDEPAADRTARSYHEVAHRSRLFSARVGGRRLCPAASLLACWASNAPGTPGAELAIRARVIRLLVTSTGREVSPV